MQQAGHGTLIRDLVASSWRWATGPRPESTVPMLENVRDFPISVVEN
ncbi:hypothetical protein [Halomonas salifodinae]